MMKVSVLIPTNRLQFMGEVFESLQNQTVPPHEILVEYSLVRGQSEKVNKLASMATGDAVMVMCDDDKLDPTFIEKTVAKMEEGYDVVYTDLQKFGLEEGILRGADYTEENFRISTVPWITSLVRKSTFDLVNGWDKDQEYQDYDFYYRCFKAGATGICIHEPLFIYRIHNKSVSFNMDHEAARAMMKAKHPEIRTVWLKRMKGRVIRNLVRIKNMFRNGD